MRVQEKLRLQRASAMQRDSLREHIAWLDIELTHALRTSPVWHDKDDLIKAIPGVGALTRATMLALLPELGSLSRRQIAAMVGVAPFNRDSGKHQGGCVIWGGRAQVRRILYLAAVSEMRCNPPIRSFYQHLRAQGKPAKVALTVCLRTLLVIMNAMLKHQFAGHRRLTRNAVGRSLSEWLASARGSLNSPQSELRRRFRFGFDPWRKDDSIQLLRCSLHRSLNALGGGLFSDVSDCGCRACIRSCIRCSSQR